MNSRAANSGGFAGPVPPPPPIEFFLVLPDGSCTPATPKACRIVMKQARSEQRKQARIKQREKAVQLQMALEDRAAARRLLEELAELSRGSRRWTARFKVQAVPAQSDTQTSPVKKRLKPSTKAPRAATDATRPASSWVIDDHGQRGIIWQQSYLGRKSAKFYRGAARDKWDYIVRDEAVLLDATGEPIILSNMGEDWIEIGAGWQAMEDASIRKNAKIQIMAIAPFDSDMSQGEMIAALKHFCTTVLGQLGLPYSAVVHAPPDHSDERNFHPHIAFSLRPMRRVGHYCWEIADDVCGELDGRDGVQALRHLWAHSMSEAAAQTDRNLSYTGLGYGARGLGLEAGVHLGEGMSAIVARGGHVWAHERNRIKNARNAARRRIRDFDRKIEALTKVRDAAVARSIVDADRVRPSRQLIAVDASRETMVRAVSKPPMRRAKRLERSATRCAQQALTASHMPVAPVARATSSASPSPAMLRAAQTTGRPPVGTASPRPAASWRRVASAAIESFDRPLAVTASVEEPVVRPTSSASRQRPIVRASSNDTETDVGRLLAATQAPAPTKLLRIVSKDRPSPGPDPVTVQAEAMLIEIRTMQERDKARARRRRSVSSASMVEQQGAVHLTHERAKPGGSQPNPPGNRPPLERERPTGGPPLPHIPVVVGSARWRRALTKSQTDGSRALPTSLSRVWLERNPRTTWSDAASRDEELSRRRIAHIERIDAYVADLRDGSFDLDIPAMTAIGVDDDWVRRADVQRALSAIRERQQILMGALAAQALDRPHAFARHGTRFWPRDLAPADLARLDRWAVDPGFQQDIFAIEQIVRNARRSPDAKQPAITASVSAAPASNHQHLATPIPDGFGGTRDTPAPVFRFQEIDIKVIAFDSQGSPSKSLLTLLRHCGEHPHTVHFADDGRLIGEEVPKLIDPLIRMWRHDTRVEALVVETISGSRAAGRAVFPQKYASAIRALSPSPKPPRHQASDINLSR